MRGGLPPMVVRLHRRAGKQESVALLARIEVGGDGDLAADDGFDTFALEEARAPIEWYQEEGVAEVDRQDRGCEERAGKVIAEKPGDDENESDGRNKPHPERVESSDGRRLLEQQAESDQSHHDDPGRCQRDGDHPAREMAQPDREQQRKRRHGWQEVALVTLVGDAEEGRQHDHPDPKKHFEM